MMLLESVASTLRRGSTTNCMRSSGDVMARNDVSRQEGRDDGEWSEPMRQPMLAGLQM